MNQTIIRNTAAYGDYPFEGIDSLALLQLQRAFAGLKLSYQVKRVSGLLRCLECYLQVTDQQISEASLLNVKSFSILLKRFMGALNSDRLIESSIQWKYTMSRLYLDMLEELKHDIPTIKIPEININFGFIAPELKHLANEFNTASLNEEKVWLWRGWHSINRNGAVSMMPLYPIYKRLGKEFTQNFFEVCDQYYRTRKNVNVAFIRPMAMFIDKYPGPLTSNDFLRPEFAGHFWRDLFVFYVRNGYADGTGLPITSIISLWRNGFLQFIKDYLIPSGLFVEPWGELPSPASKTVRGSRTNIKTTPQGHEIKTKLLTHIPLHVSDEEALHLLFKQIEADVQEVINWAEWSCGDIWRRYQRRLYLATIGTVRVIIENGAKGENQWLTDRKNPDYLANAAATFGFYGFLTAKQASLDILYPRPLNNIAAELALPIADALLPHCMLLVAEHPAITSSFLVKLEVFDKNGKLTGFAETDVGFQLVSHKDRRGPRLAQQIISLTPRTTEIVRQILALTEPLRDYLRKQGDDQWRYLLLTSKQGFGYPQRVSSLAISASQCKQRDRLVESFGNTSKLSSDERIDLVNRLSLQTLRASCGVLVYLKTRSTEKMAKALGHAVYRPGLLEHYLPKLILDFYQERWIRIFQTGIIVEALKESPRLLEASNFTSMDELDQFLSHHALRLIPQHLISADEKATASECVHPVQHNEVLFGVNTGILTALISLQLAVESAQEPVNAKATYWAGISRRLVSYIELELSDRTDLQGYLRFALGHVNPTKLAGMLYDK